MTNQSEALPPVWPFVTPDAVPPDNAAELHLLLTVHTLITLLAFLGGPITVWRAVQNRADWVFWLFAVFPLGVEGQRLLAGNRCVVQDMAQRLWQAPPGVWAPDLYGVHASWVTYVVDACIVSYAAGLSVSVILFLRRRRGWLSG